MRPVTVTVGPIGASDVEAVFKAAPIVAAGYLTLDGNSVVDGVAEFDAPRLVYFEGANNFPSVDFTVTGTTWGGAPATEVVNGAAFLTGTETVQSFLTVTSVYASGDTGGDDVYIGTNEKSATAWVRFDPWVKGGVSVQMAASGTVNYTLQQTLDDVNSLVAPVLPGSVEWVDSNDTNVVGATSSKQTNYLFAPTFSRVVLNSGTGYVTATFAQSGSVVR